MKTCDNCTNKDWCLITRPDLYYEMLVFQGASVCPKYSSVKGDKKMKVLKRVKIRLRSTNKIQEFLTNKEVRLYKLNEACGVLSIISAVDGTKYVINWDDILMISVENVEEESEYGSSL